MDVRRNGEEWKVSRSTCGAGMLLKAVIKQMGEEGVQGVDYMLYIHTHIHPVNVHHNYFMVRASDRCPHRPRVPSLDCYSSHQTHTAPGSSGVS